MKIALMLLVMGFGYKIFAEASLNKKKSLKNLGRTIAIFMMVVGLLGTLCGGYHMMKKGMLGHGYGYGKQCGYNHYAAYGEDSGKKICPFAAAQK